MEYFIGFIIGFIIGALIVIIISLFLLKRMKDSFDALSLKALSQNSTEFLKIADQTLSKQTQEGTKELDTKKLLIDQTLKNMNTDMKTELKNVNDLVNKLEKDRENKFGELNEKLENTAKQTGELQKATNQLNAVLSNTKVRGQWGEKMAEDILNLVGLKENG
jgi:DNA recombination protein RmuC